MLTASVFEVLQSAPKLAHLTIKRLIGSLNKQSTVLLNPSVFASGQGKSLAGRSVVSKLKQAANLFKDTSSMQLHSIPLECFVERQQLTVEDFELLNSCQQQMQKRSFIEIVSQDEFECLLFFLSVPHLSKRQEPNRLESIPIKSGFTCKVQSPNKREIRCLSDGSFKNSQYENSVAGRQQLNSMVCSSLASKISASVKSKLSALRGHSLSAFQSFKRTKLKGDIIRREECPHQPAPKSSSWLRQDTHASQSLACLLLLLLLFSQRPAARAERGRFRTEKPL